jgi:hypothetical protein
MSKGLRLTSDILSVLFKKCFYEYLDVHQQAPIQWIPSIGASCADVSHISYSVMMICDCLSLMLMNMISNEE